MIPLYKHGLLTQLPAVHVRPASLRRFVQCAKAHKQHSDGATEGCKHVRRLTMQPHVRRCSAGGKQTKISVRRHRYDPHRFAIRTKHLFGHLPETRVQLRWPCFTRQSCALAQMTGDNSKFRARICFSVSLEQTRFTKKSHSGLGE